MARFSLPKRTTSSSSGPSPTLVQTLLLALRFLQFVFALTVLGLYGTDLNRMRKAHEHADSRWVYAEVVGGLSALTALVFAVLWKRTRWLWGWDAVLL